MLRTGDTVGSYRLEEKLASGGFGAVWRTRLPGGRESAIKILHPNLAAVEVAGGPSPLDRFVAESRFLQANQHPGLVRVLDVVRDDDRCQHAFVMELLTGFELRHVAKLIELTTLLAVFSRVGDVLDFVHRRDVIHRDVTVRNIMVCSEGDGRPHVKLIDFGIAKDIDVAGAVDSTKQGQFVGAEKAMAPECWDRVLGKPVQLTPAVDQWSVGVALFQCLTGKLPFSASNVLVQQELVQGAEVPQVQLRPHFGVERTPEPLRLLVERCLQKRPNDRFGTAAEMAAAFREAAEHLRPSTATDPFEETLDAIQTRAGVLHEPTLVLPSRSEELGPPRSTSGLATTPDGVFSGLADATVRIPTDPVLRPQQAQSVWGAAAGATVPDPAEAVGGGPAGASEVAQETLRDSAPAEVRTELDRARPLGLVLEEDRTELNAHPAEGGGRPSIQPKTEPDRALGGESPARRASPRRSSKTAEVLRATLPRDQRTQPAVAEVGGRPAADSMPAPAWTTAPRNDGPKWGVVTLVVVAASLLAFVLGWVLRGR